MKEKNRNCAKRFSYIIALFVLICAGSLYVSEEPGQAKTYSSTKQVKAQIKRLNKKIKKLRRHLKKRMPDGREQQEEEQLVRQIPDILVVPV